MFQNKVIVITGGAGGIGKCIAEEFQNQGAHVCVIDCIEGDHYVGDIADKETLEDFVQTVIAKYGKVDVLINNAPPGFRGIDECTYEQFQRSMAIGVTAPFYLSKLFAPPFCGRSQYHQYFLVPRPHEPASERKLHRSKGRHRCPNPCAGGFPCRKSPGQLHQPWMDRYCLYGLRRSRCHPTARRPCGQSSGYCQYGAVSGIRQGWFHHQREYLHRWWSDKTYDLSRRPWLDLDSIMLQAEVPYALPLITFYPFFSWTQEKKGAFESCILFILC